VEHRLIERDPETLTGKCQKCGPVVLRRKANGAGRPHRLVCSMVKLEERGNIVRPHGMTVAEARVFCQGKVCEICRSDYRLGVDHDHQTGEVRGVLCHNCNVGLGHFRDDPALVVKVISYLCGHTYHKAPT
jgi:recombination endonuclease VII